MPKQRLATQAKANTTWVTLGWLIALPATSVLAQDSQSAPAPEPAAPAAPPTSGEPPAPPPPPEEPPATTESEEVVVVGSRVKPRSDTETPSPVDVLSAEDLEKTGTTELGKALQMLAPSFNFSTTTISDGTDIIRPATLRGLGPDQVLVLVNGKRRHQMALVNVQETIGKGSAGYDLNAIPMAAIERIEILRDGAAAQYGSDAIAGVINIVLKKRTGLQLETGAGRYYESNENVYGFLDTFGASVNGGFLLGGHGVLNLTLEYRERGLTDRAGVATLESTMGELIGDWYDDGKPVKRLRIGDAQARTLSAFYNGEYDLGDAITLYSFGGISRRTGESSGFFRGPGHPRVPLELYPQGFLPTLLTRVDDMSALAGVRAELSEHWKLDTSVGWGRSVFNFGSENSVNVSWFYEPDASGNPRLQSPTEADDGSLLIDMLNANVDLNAKYPMPWGQPLFFATGAAFRIDAYQIAQGDEVSWSYGRTNDPRITILNTSVNPPAPAEAGIQGFPGFGPATTVNEGRPSVAIYVDGETDLFKSWMVGLAGRFESIYFEDHSLTGKFTTRVDPADFLSLRGTVSNGFRAPGIQQLYYSQVLTNLIDGELVETGTIANNSPVARAVGIQPLKPETSYGASVGIVFKPDVWLDRPTRAVSLTVDVFFLKIQDRIVLSESVDGEDNPELMDILGANRLGAAQFLTNAVDTTTLGADIVGAWDVAFSQVLDLKLSAALSLVKTQVDDVHSQSSLVADDELFSETQRLRLERGQPREKATLSAATRLSDFMLRLATNYFGPVSGMAFTGVRKDWSGKWLTDASISYAPSALPGFQVTLGGTNIFDVYPDEWERTAGQVYYEAGFTYGWETLPLGIGGYYYLNLAYTM
ncbi:MAG TPA: TonB-dependent receptor [Polyangiales bacterium]|nr:TonB-dependent receptor [Polyangiales bacterium]